MDEQTFQRRVERLKEVNAVIEELDPSVRAEAFLLLRPYVEEDTGTGERTSTNLGSSVDGEEISTSGLATLIEAHSTDKPADAVFVLAAHLFSEYGSEPFSVEEINSLGQRTGLTVPKRIDMTLSQAKRDGKALFRKVSKGNFEPTVTGELYLKNTFEVKKGSKKRPADDGA